MNQNRFNDKKKKNENIFLMEKIITIEHTQQTRQPAKGQPVHSLHTHYTYTHNYTYNFMITTFTHPPAYGPSDQQTGNVPIIVCCNGRYRNIKKVLCRSLVFAIAIVIANFFFINKGWGQGSQTFNTPGSTTIYCSRRRYVNYRFGMGRRWRRWWRNRRQSTGRRWW